MKYFIVLCALIAVAAAAARQPAGRQQGRQQQQQQARYQQPRQQARPVPAPVRGSPIAKTSYNQVTSANEDSSILSKSYDLNPDGSYGWEFEAANGISASENGVGGQYAKGAAEWTSPEGEHVVLQYTADENGYQPSGSHVPQIPEYILRALEYIRTHPNPEYQNY